MLQHDSTGQEPVVTTEAPSPRQTAKPRTPYQVLRELSGNATPAQQDSAIQAAFQPKEIHYSTCPDTLHLPGHGIGKSLKDVSLPEYYREGFFAGDTLLHPEIPVRSQGVAGDPVPHTVRTDDTINIILIACFVLTIAAFSKSRRFIVRQTKRFFHMPHNDAANVTETSGEVRFQFFLALQSCLLFSIIQYFYTRHYIGSTFILESQYHLIAIFFGMYAGYFAIKSLLYAIVNTIFFGARKNLTWQKATLFITSMEGVMLFPVVLLQVYFDLPMQSVLYYVIFILIAIKILTLYKCYLIFFKRRDVYLQIILYFCALEIAPVVSLWGTLVITGNYLRINF